MRQALGPLIALLGSTLAAARLPAQEPPTLERCGPPSRPIGTLSGTGAVRFRITEKGRVDSASIEVIRANGVSPEGILSVARRWLPGCRYRAARQAGHAVALTVEQPLQFPVSGVALSRIRDPAWQVVDEMPTAYDCHPGSVGGRRGSITLTFTIDTTGRAEAPTVQLVSADVPASRALLQRLAKVCRYTPARDHGILVEMDVNQQFVFLGP